MGQMPIVSLELVCRPISAKSGLNLLIWNAETVSVADHFRARLLLLVLTARRQGSRRSGHVGGCLVDSFGVKALYSRHPGSDAAVSSCALHVSMVPTRKNLPPPSSGARATRLAVWLPPGFDFSKTV